MCTIALQRYNETTTVTTCISMNAYVHQTFPLPSSIFHLPSSLFHLPSSIFPLPSSIPLKKASDNPSAASLYHKTT